MKNRYIENGLAVLGALIVLIGVSSAASSAFAASDLELGDADRISLPGADAE